MTTSNTTAAGTSQDKAIRAQTSRRGRTALVAAGPAREVRRT